MNDEYEGVERRKGNIENRVRDLEESDRAGAKSRQAMHKQLGDMSVKLDLVLSVMGEKAEECAGNKTETALLKAAHTVLSDTISTMATSIKDLSTSTAQAIRDIQDDQKWATRAAATGLVATVGGLAAYIWKVTVGK
jgi:chromosome segregation ATPase